MRTERVCMSYFNVPWNICDHDMSTDCAYSYSTHDSNYIAYCWNNYFSGNLAF